MAELHDLSPAGGSHRNRKRVGRGPGSGTGKTSGRGEKGQKARSGGGIPAGFEGGQMPLHRRIPKRGFTNINRVEYQVVNVSELARVEGDVTPESLRAAGLVSSLRRPIKVLGNGDIEVAKAVTVHAFSKSAKAKIEAAGGAVNVPGTEAVAVEDDAPAAEEAPVAEAAAEEAPVAEETATDEDAASEDDGADEEQA